MPRKPTGKALTNAEKQRNYRERKKERIRQSIIAEAESLSELFLDTEPERKPFNEMTSQELFHTVFPNLKHLDIK